MGEWGEREREREREGVEERKSFFAATLKKKKKSFSLFLLFSRLRYKGTFVESPWGNNCGNKVETEGFPRRIFFSFPLLTCPSNKHANETPCCIACIPTTLPPNPSHLLKSKKMTFSLPDPSFHSPFPWEEISQPSSIPTCICSEGGRHTWPDREEKMIFLE